MDVVISYFLLFLSVTTFFYAAFLPIYLESRNRNTSPAAGGPPVLLTFTLYILIAIGLFRLSKGNGFDYLIADIATVIVGLVMNIIPTLYITKLLMKCRWNTP